MDAPAEAPHKVAGKGVKGGLAALKKLPPWAFILIAGGLLLAVIYMRHQQANAATTSTAATNSDSATSDPNYNPQDPYSSGYGNGYDTSGLYDTGYQQGLNDASTAGGGGLGAGTSNGTDIPPPAGASTAPTITVNEPTINFPTGGGMSTTTTTTHQPSGKQVAPGTHLGNGGIEAPSGSKKPPPKAGYTVRGLGGGRWAYEPVKKSPNKKKKKTN